MAITNTKHDPFYMRRFFATSKQGGDGVMQLGGSDPNMLAEACEVLVGERERGGGGGVKNTKNTER